MPVRRAFKQRRDRANDRRTHRTITALARRGLLSLVLVAATADAATNDIFPGDYYPIDPGDKVVSLYAFDRRNLGPYAGGEKLANGEVRARIGAIRGVSGLELGGLTAAAVAVLTYADLKSSPNTLADAIGSRSSGLGDLRLGLTIWPINQPQRANYLGVTAMVIAPTGDYDSQQLLNYGENRWRWVLAGGWQKDITPRLLFELMPELTLYGDNPDHAGGQRLEQDPAFALTGYLRWRVTRAFHLHIGAQRNWGGGAEVDGIALNNPPENTRVNLGLTWFLPGKQQIILRLAEETQIENGFRIGRELALRYQKSF
jgi:hypothetical protein